MPPFCGPFCVSITGRDGPATVGPGREPDRAPDLTPPPPAGHPRGIAPDPPSLFHTAPGGAGGSWWLVHAGTGVLTGHSAQIATCLSIRSRPRCLPDQRHVSVTTKAPGRRVPRRGRVERRQIHAPLLRDDGALWCRDRRRLRRCRKSDTCLYVGGHCVVVHTDDGRDGPDAHAFAGEVADELLTLVAQQAR